MMLLRQQWTGLCNIIESVFVQYCLKPQKLHYTGFFLCNIVPGILRQHSTGFSFLHNVVWSLMDNTAQGFYLCKNGPWLTDNFYEGNNLYNVVSIMGQHCRGILSSQCCQMRSRQHCTRKSLAQCWPRVHRYTFAGKPLVSKMSGGLFINREHYHRTILAFFVQCWLRSLFTACARTMNRG